MKVPAADGDGRPRARARPLVRPAVVAAALVLTGALLAAVRVSLPSDGTVTAAWAAKDGGVSISVLGRHGALRDGDRVVAVDGEPLAGRSPWHPFAHGPHTYRVVRAGGVVDVPVTAHPYPLATVLARHWASMVVVGSSLLIAVYVFGRRRTDPAAEGLLLCAAVFTCGATSWIFGLQVGDLGGGPGWWASAAGGVAYALLWPTLLRFALVFPSVAPPVRRHRRLLPATYLVAAVLYLLRTGTALPRATTPLARAAALTPHPVADELVFPVVILGVLLVRYSRSSGLDRTHLRWIAGSFTVSTLLYFALWKLPLLLTGRALIAEPVHTLVFLPCPVAIGVAVLRCGLFDIHVVVRRSLVYALVSARVAAVYALAVGVVTLAVGGRDHHVAVVATGVTALALSPLQRVRRPVSRMLYGDRDNPSLIVARLAQLLRASAEPAELWPELVQTLRVALRVPYVAVDLGPAGAGGARSGVPTDGALTLPLVHAGELMGHLVVGERTPGEGFGRLDRAVLDGLAPQLAVTAWAARVTGDLDRSRARVVAAREDERGRIRRDLHDGLGPVLAATGLQLRTAQRLIERDPGEAAALLGELAERTTSAISEVRQLVDELRPAALDRLGLAHALADEAARFDGVAGMAATVTVDGDLGDVPAPVATAALRIVAEALTNAGRHSGARRCTVRVACHDSVEIDVTDDGRGIDGARRPGVGMASMRVRAVELGGSFLVETRPEGGTRVFASLPLPRP